MHKQHSFGHFHKVGQTVFVLNAERPKLKIIDFGEIRVVDDDGDYKTFVGTLE